jgi:DNA-binding PadR family transcriptional regulator
LYLEPKNLVRRGLAVGQVCSTGERRRTVYEITASGRQALTDWIHKAPRGMSTEFEALLRLAAPGVTPGAVVQQVRACAAAQLHMARQAATAAHSADFDQSTHHRLVAEFEVHLARAQMEWAAWAEGWLAQTRPQPSRAEPTFAEPRTAEPTMPAATDWASWLD